MLVNTAGFIDDFMPNTRIPQDLPVPAAPAGPEAHNEDADKIGPTERNRGMTAKGNVTHWRYSLFSEIRKPSRVEVFLFSDGDIIDGVRFTWTMDD